MKISLKQAEDIANEIDASKELVVLWASPRNRAQESANIIPEVFEKKGIIIHTTKGLDKIRTKESMREVDS
mgnify:CR=1 FL=1